MSHTNVAADAVRTVEWLSAEGITYVVPVYQRRYRWEADACERLLEDVRAVADADGARTHFFGSILYTDTAHGDVRERMLVDGQQRVTTLMLLLAAIRDTLGDTEEEIAAACDRVLLHPEVEGHTKLTLRKRGARALDGVVFGRTSAGEREEASHVRDNFEFFRNEIRADAANVWRGVRRLEHVVITLGEHASPQQVFESLNSTGTPLHNHELIHNYVLMGLNHEQQVHVEDSYWVPIEENTGEAIDSFLRDYLVFRTGRDSELSGERGTYEVFRAEFPSPRYESLLTHAAEWRTLSEVYRVLLEPSRQDDPEIERQLRYVNTFGRAMYPLLLGVYRDYQDQKIDRETLLEILEQLQSLYLRKMVVGASRDHLAAQLCRKLRQYGYPMAAIPRRTPSDERVRQALAYQPLRHAGYVLGRIDEPGDLDSLQVEHIFPQHPTDTWSPDGIRRWHEFDERERARYREVLSTIGNLALLEQSLNAGAGNKSFPAKREYFAKSEVESTCELTDTPAWTLEAIAERTARLTERFLEIWRREGVAVEGADHLVPILDVPRRPDYYKGWKTEFEYVQFQDETWEIRNVRSLFERVFRRLWESDRAAVLAYSAAHEGPVFETEEWSSRWASLPGSHYLFMAEYPQYQLARVQQILDQFDMADEVFVKFTAEED